MTGDEIRRAREARQWTQQDLAKRVGVGLRTIGNWERGESVPRSRMGAIEQLFGNPAGEAAANPLRDATDFDLLSELIRRALDRERG